MKGNEFNQSFKITILSYLGNSQLVATVREIFGMMPNKCN